MADTRIVRIEWARLSGQRPRKAGCNARLGEHGSQVRPPIARITTSDGAVGFGLSGIPRESAAQLVGFRLEDAFQLGTAEPYRALDVPLWDLAGKLAGKPVYALLQERAPSSTVHGPQSTVGSPQSGVHSPQSTVGSPQSGVHSPESAGGGLPLSTFRAPCYDTSLYFDDLHLSDDEDAAALIASEALEGAARGHRHFKLKVGRGAMHLPLEQGTRRDILVIRAVREAVGPDARLLIDANNGYNLNLTKRVLGDTAAAGVYWMEEAFHEDPRLLAHLKEWLRDQGLRTLIADGEGDASRHILDWARQGLIDVVQYDLGGTGFTRWLELGAQFDGWNVRSAPHHYGNHYNNYSACHLAAAIRGFEFVEWDEAETPGLDASAYRIVDGWVEVPSLPGFGLSLDDEIFARAVQEGGWVVEGA